MRLQLFRRSILLGILLALAHSLGSAQEGARAVDKQRFTGMWRGTYHYPEDGQAPVEFEIAMLQEGKNLIGMIQEPNTFGDPAEPKLLATLKGHISDQTGEMIFTKTYDGTGGQSHDVEYSGKPNDNATKVVGTWNIQGLVGQFTLEKVNNTQSGDVSCFWSGKYVYPEGSNRDSVQFEMIAVHQGKTLLGFMKEPNTFGKRADEPWLHASLKAELDDAGKWQITKTYNGTAGEDHKVDYVGVLNKDRTKLEGTWSIGDDLSGTFVLEKADINDPKFERLKK